MKYFVVLCCALLHLANSNVLLDYAKKYICPKSSDPEYEKCILERFESMKRYYTTGFPELGMPPLDPYVLPYMSVNRTINDLMSINAVLKDVKIIGLKNTIIDDFKADLTNYAEEIRYTVPWLYMETDYDLGGQIISIPVQSSGHFQGNFTAIQMYVKVSLKTYKKDGVEYFKVNKINTKLFIGDGEIRLTSKNKEMKDTAVMVSQFFNENSRRLLDVVTPLLIDWTKDFQQEMYDEILGMLPASEWLPA